MESIGVYDLIQRRILVIRASARAVEPLLTTALARGEREVALDFKGVEGITPSFFDETMLIIQEHSQATAADKFRVILTNLPPHLSPKYEAVGQRHGLSVEESDDGAWVISKIGAGN